jgi:hypothetical protein
LREKGKSDSWNNIADAWPELKGRLNRGVLMKSRAKTLGLDPDALRNESRKIEEQKN